MPLVTLSICSPYTITTNINGNYSILPSFVLNQLQLWWLLFHLRLCFMDKLQNITTTSPTTTPVKILPMKVTVQVLLTSGKLVRGHSYPRQGNLYSNCTRLESNSSQHQKQCSSDELHQLRPQKEPEGQYIDRLSSCSVMERILSILP